MKNLLLFVLLVVGTTLPACLTTLQPLVTEVNIIQDHRIRGNWQSNKGIIAIETLPDTKMLEKDDSSSMSWLPSRTTRRDSLFHVKLFDIVMNEKGVKQFMTSTTLVGDKGYVDGKIEKSNNVRDSIFFAKNYGVIFKHNHYQHMMAGALTRVGNNLFFQLMPLAIDDRLTDGTGYEYGFDYTSSFSIGRVVFEQNNKLSIQFLNGDYIKELIRGGQVRIKHEKDHLFGTFLITASSGELKQFLEKYGDDERLYSKNSTITLTRKG